MNYRFSDKWDIRYYLDKEVGVKVTDEIFDIIDKDEEEYKKEKKNLEEYSRYTEQMEERLGLTAGLVSSRGSSTSYGERKGD